MSQGGRNWEDLRPRVITGVILIVVGIAEIAIGGPIFAISVAIIAGIIVWELSRMIAADKAAEAVQLAVIAAVCLLLARNMGAIFTIPLLLVPAIAGTVLLRTKPVLFGIYAFGIVAAGYEMTVFRDVQGVVWLFWLVIVVVATDVAGYFAGRMIGGPKFWPAISPKKTWSGIVAGWIAAACVGVFFAFKNGIGTELIILSIALSFASQMGDIAQSALKRKLGVKDSSTLLPGHGGVFDRFDALLGAALFLFVVSLLITMPELR